MCLWQTDSLISTLIHLLTLNQPLIKSVQGLLKYLQKIIESRTYFFFFSIIISLCANTLENPICSRCLFRFALQTVPSHNVGGRIRQIHPQNIMDQPRYCPPLQTKTKERCVQQTCKLEDAQGRIWL